MEISVPGGSVARIFAVLSMASDRLLVQRVSSPFQFTSKSVCLVFQNPVTVEKLKYLGSLVTSLDFSQPVEMNARIQRAAKRSLRGAKDRWLIVTIPPHRRDR